MANINKGIIAPEAVYSIAFTGTSTAATDIMHGASGVQQMVFEAETADCWVLFGTANVAAADSTAWPLYVGQPIMFQVGKPQQYIRVIRQGSVSGTLKYFIPGHV